MEKSWEEAIKFALIFGGMAYLCFTASDILKTARVILLELRDLKHKLLDKNEL